MNYSPYPSDLRPEIPNFRHRDTDGALMDTAMLLTGEVYTDPAIAKAALAALIKECRETLSGAAEERIFIAAEASCGRNRNVAIALKYITTESVRDVHIAVVKGDGNELFADYVIKGAVLGIDTPDGDTKLRLQFDNTQYRRSFMLTAKTHRELLSTLESHGIRAENVNFIKIGLHAFMLSHCLFLAGLLELARSCLGLSVSVKTGSLGSNSGIVPGCSQFTRLPDWPTLVCEGAGKATVCVGVIFGVVMGFYKFISQGGSGAYLSVANPQTDKDDPERALCSELVSVGAGTVQRVWGSIAFDGLAYAHRSDSLDCAVLEVTDIASPDVLPCLIYASRERHSGRWLCDVFASGVNSAMVQFPSWPKSYLSVDFFRSRGKNDRRATKRFPVKKTGENWFLGSEASKLKLEMTQQLRLRKIGIIKKENRAIYPPRIGEANRLSYNPEGAIGLPR